MSQTETPEGLIVPTSAISPKNLLMGTVKNRCIATPVQLNTGKTAGGLFIPDKSSEKVMFLKIVKLGPEVQHLNVDDVVYPNPRLAMGFMVDGVQYFTFLESEVLVYLREGVTEKEMEEDDDLSI